MALLAVGTKAPDFTMRDTTGKEIKLSALKGNKVVLYFYPKDDTPGCTVEACEFRDYNKDIVKKGALVFGVSADDEKSHQKFTEKYKLNFPLLVDEGTKVSQKYGTWGEKSMYGRKYMGMLRTTYIVDEQGKIAHVFEKVKPLGHAKEVLAALEQ
ncbi:MAG: thioredoxin-dependent thiol peroxidase [Candidatus Iainarchaeum archaeon]|uniref:thioredoxin-dependent peroxiredoxin n=1 Tax=Candidatus Iainarchaeum sp. TaxID=3101447 RepID=A0A7T9DKM7_9ARCH|nr:MAG: thioredoxin-dependent thiol peroxidase [Candidatus Diapherotrites archaeon]